MYIEDQMTSLFGTFQMDIKPTYLSNESSDILCVWF